MTEVRLERLSKRYDSTHHAVVDLSLTLPCGQITALLGPSGCGKTTILKLIAGLLAPTAGEITFDGRSVLDVAPEKRGAVMVFQNHLLFPTMSVFDNVAFGLKMRGTPTAEMRRRVGEMLELVKLPDCGNRRPHQLSGGQKQRVALARALIVAPRVLLLDEPLSNLDAHLRNEMRDLIFALQRQLRITTLVVTHDQEEAVILGDRLALLFNGVLQQVGDPSDFYERPLTTAIARFFGGVNFIPGRKQGARVQTTLGAFEVAASAAQPDGPVVLTVRPEAVRFAGGPGPNTIAGVIVGHVYTGAYTRFKVATADPALPPIELLTDAAARLRHRDGDTVHLHFPPATVWPVAADGRAAVRG